MSHLRVKLQDASAGVDTDYLERSWLGGPHVGLLNVINLGDGDLG